MHSGAKVNCPGWTAIPRTRLAALALPQDDAASGASLRSRSLRKTPRWLLAASLGYIRDSRRSDAHTNCRVRHFACLTIESRVAARGGPAGDSHRAWAWHAGA